MKTLTAKTIARTTKFINQANASGVQVIKDGATQAMQERDPNGTQYAIAKLELEIINKL